MQIERKIENKNTKDKNLQILIPFHFTIFLSKKLYKSTIFLKILSKVHLKISIDQTFSTNKPVLICTIQVSLNYLKKTLRPEGCTYERRRKRGLFQSVREPRSRGIRLIVSNSRNPGKRETIYIKSAPVSEFPVLPPSSSILVI